MKHPRLRHLVAGTALAALLIGLPNAFAGSELPTGAAAPAFEGKEFINTEEISMNDLRGQVVLYEIFRSW